MTTSPKLPTEANSTPRSIKTWGDVYNRHLAKGRDHSDAAYRADQWEKRQVAAAKSREATRVTHQMVRAFAKAFWEDYHNLTDDQLRGVHAALTAALAVERSAK